jgi:transposase
MVEGQVLPQQEHVEQLRHLTKTDPDPRVRRRAHGVLLVEQGQSLAQVARFFGTAPHRVRAWQERFLTAGRAGLADQARGGRPPKLNEAALAFVHEALDRGPQAYGFPVTTWTLCDLQTLLLRERQVQVSVATLYRVVHTLGYRYRRPRHDLTHRQNAEAVAGAKRLLEWLQKKQLLSPDDSIWSISWSISTNVKSMPIRTWRKSGARRDSR